MDRPSRETWASRLPRDPVRVERRPVRAAATCRCGTPIPVDSEGYCLVHAPTSIEYILGDRAFCSLHCVRAFLLETLAEMEGITLADAERTVVDLRETYMDLARAFADLAFGPARSLA
jgi:hypothetical protein